MHHVCPSVKTAKYIDEHHSSYMYTCKSPHDRQTIQHNKKQAKLSLE